MVVSAISHSSLHQPHCLPSIEEPWGHNGGGCRPSDSFGHKPPGIAQVNMVPYAIQEKIRLLPNLWGKEKATYIYSHFRNQFLSLPWFLTTAYPTNMDCKSSFWTLVIIPVCQTWSSKRAISLPVISQRKWQFLRAHQWMVFTLWNYFSHNEQSFGKVYLLQCSDAIFPLSLWKKKPAHFVEKEGGQD